MISGIIKKARQSKELKIEFQKEFYLPGDSLNGRVLFHPKKDVFVDCLKIFFCGEEYCFWLDKIVPLMSTSSTNTMRVIFKKHILLISDKTHLTSEVHTWHFSFIVLRGIPPSCNYKKQAQVGYFLKAKVCTGFGHFDFVSSTPITVGQRFAQTIPTPVSKRERLIHGLVIVESVCSHSVARCNEPIFCTIRVSNDSSRMLTCARLKLKQVWECCGVIVCKNVVCKTESREGFPVSRGSCQRTLRMTIPNISNCPTVTNATNFSCTYYIGVYLVTKLGGIQKERVKCHVPIIISNNPLVDEHPSIPPSPPPDTTVSNTSENLSQLFSPQDDFSEPEDNNETWERMTSELESIQNWANNSGNDEEQVPETKTTAQTSNLSEGGHGDHEVERSCECVICYDGPKDMLLLPCAHIATCQSCTSEIMRTTKLCPVCRTRVSQVLRTYQV